MTEQEQLQDFLSHKYHGSFTKSEHSVFSIDYTCVVGTKHTIYSPCIAGLTLPDDCGCRGKTPEPKHVAINPNK